MAGSSSPRQLQHSAKERGPLCPEAALRASLDDGDFWEYVFNHRLPGDPEPYEGPWDDGPPEVAYTPQHPCEVCGAITACGYDEEGRPMIHATEDHDA